MRLLSLLLVGAVFSSLSFSQIPNAGFESWETDPDSNSNPVGWQTTNSFPLVGVEQYSPGCQGNYAMKVKTISFGFTFPAAAILEAPYPFAEAPTRFSACIKSTIMPGDRAYLIVGLMKGDSIIALQDSCTFKIDSTISQFSYREFPLKLQSNLVPDSMIIIVASGLGTGQVGTELIVDDLAFTTGTTSVPAKEVVPGSFSLHQNYPNPFNPSTTIEYEIPKLSRVELHIYNFLGQHVATLVNEEQLAGRYSIVWNGQNKEGAVVSSGSYFCRLQAGVHSETKRLTLLK